MHLTPIALPRDFMMMMDGSSLPYHPNLGDQAPHLEDVSLAGGHVPPVASIQPLSFQPTGPQQPATIPQPLNMKALQVTNLDPASEFIHLHNHFERFGEIILCRVLKDAKTGISRGIGYVNFAHEDAAAAAQRETDGRPGPRGEAALIVKFAEHDPSYKPVATTKVFVRYVPLHITHSDIRQAFSKYGQVLDVTIDLDSSRVVKRCSVTWNYAYVRYKTTREANLAIANAPLDINWGPQKIITKPAETEDSRAARGSASKKAQATVPTFNNTPPSAHGAPPTQPGPMLHVPSPHPSLVQAAPLLRPATTTMPFSVPPPVISLAPVTHYHHHHQHLPLVWQAQPSYVMGPHPSMQAPAAPMVVPPSHPVVSYPTGGGGVPMMSYVSVPPNSMVPVWPGAPTPTQFTYVLPQ